MPQAIDHRRIINAIIITLGLFIFALTVEGVWEAYREYKVVQDMAYANEMADRVIAAAAFEAMERGTTANAFGLSAPANAEMMRNISVLREKGDAAWNHALHIARKMKKGLTADSEFAEAINHAEQEHASLQKLRQRVDLCLEGRACNYSAEEWLKDMTRFISESANLRESSFLLLDTPQHVTQLNLSLKRWAWMASEHAGRERGILAYYISRRAPVPLPVLDELKANRGVVEHSIQDIQLVKNLRNTDPRIKQAVGLMEQHFAGEFDNVRQQVFSGAARGEYPVDGEQWMTISTRAIDSILAISTEVTRVTGEYAEHARIDSISHVLRHIVMLLVTFVLVLWSMSKVWQTANALFKQKELAEVTLHSIGDAVITTNAAAEVEYLNPVAEQLTGWSTEDAHGKHLGDVCVLVNGVTQKPEPSPVERCLREHQVVGLSGNVVLKAKNGKEYVIEDSAAPIREREGNVIGAVMVFYDVTQMRHAQHLLSYHATHDALTGLVNRREFERRLADLLVRAKTLGQQHALCYIDLDQFKVINDTSGHAVGDKLLRQLTYLLQESMRDSDTLARLGGDEFGILLENCPLDRALRIAENLRHVIKDFRFAWEGHYFDLGASIGLVPVNADSVSPEEVLSEADAACYAAKEKGRNRIQVFQPGNLELAKRHGEMQWVSRIKEALKQDRFHLYYQAIQSLNGDGMLHGEILLRLTDENDKLVPPMDFIPAAERYNLMPAIDAWVVRTSVKTIAGCLIRRPALSDMMIFNINLSGATLCEGNFETYILDQLACYGVPPQCVCFEITETAAVSNLEQAARLIKSLKAKGCRFALDDFGTGLSSFAYLKELPVDYLKIDGSFVHIMHTDPVAYAMVQAINTVGHVMGIQTIAEYVENEEILGKLRELDVDFAQGYAVGRPQPIEQSMAEYEVTV